MKKISTVLPLGWRDFFFFSNGVHMKSRKTFNRHKGNLLKCLLLFRVWTYVSGNYCCCIYCLLHVYRPWLPKIPSNQWEKLLCMSFNTQGRWPKDSFIFFISLERMLMNRCQFSSYFFFLSSVCLTNWCLNKADLTISVYFTESGELCHTRSM